MQRRLAAQDVLDKHRVCCPRCRCPEAVVLIDEQFEITWQCVDCESRWPASDDTFPGDLRGAEITRRVQGLTGVADFRVVTPAAPTDGNPGRVE